MKIHGKVKATASKASRSEKCINNYIREYKSSRHISSELTIPGKQLEGYEFKQNKVLNLQNNFLQKTAI